MFRDGRGVAQSNTKAAQCWKKAAEKGHSGSQCNLGQMYLRGLGMDQDIPEALRWFQMAADQGNLEANQSIQIVRDAIGGGA